MFKCLGVGHLHSFDSCPITAVKQVNKNSWLLYLFLLHRIRFNFHVACTYKLTRATDKEEVFSIPILLRRYANNFLFTI